MEILVWVIGLILLVVFIVIVVNVLRATTHVVPEERRLVIYRLGRFHRIAGPGMVQVIPGLDQVVRSFEVRNHPIEITVPGVFAFGLPNELTLNLWCSADLVRAVGDDKNKLATLAQLSEAERRQQVEVKMREALVHQIADLQKRLPLPETAGTLDGVIALAPGGERYNALLDGLTRTLEKTLPAVGVILDTSQPITVTRRGIPDAIISAISRRQGRDIDSQWLTKYARELRQQFPDMSNAILAQILSSIEGVDVGKVQRLLLEHDEDTEAQVEFEMSQDEEGPNVVTKPRLRKHPHTHAETEHEHVPEDNLSKSDLSVLKRVPRGQRDERLSA